MSSVISKDPEMDRVRLLPKESRRDKLRRLTSELFRNPANKPPIQPPLIIYWPQRTVVESGTPGSPSLLLPSTRDAVNEMVTEMLEDSDKVERERRLAMQRVSRDKSPPPVPVLEAPEFQWLKRPEFQWLERPPTPISQKTVHAQALTKVYADLGIVDGPADSHNLRSHIRMSPPASKDSILVANKSKVGSSSRAINDSGSLLPRSGHSEIRSSSEKFKPTEKYQTAKTVELFNPSSNLANSGWRQSELPPRFPRLSQYAVEQSRDQGAEDLVIIDKKQDGTGKFTDKLNKQNQKRKRQNRRRRHRERKREGKENDAGSHVDDTVMDEEECSTNSSPATPPKTKRHKPDPTERSAKFCNHLFDLNFSGADSGPYDVLRWIQRAEKGDPDCWSTVMVPWQGGQVQAVALALYGAALARLPDGEPTPFDILRRHQGKVALLKSRVMAEIFRASRQRSNLTDEEREALLQDYDKLRFAEMVLEKHMLAGEKRRLSREGKGKQVVEGVSGRWAPPPEWDYLDSSEIKSLNRARFSMNGTS